MRLGRQVVLPWLAWSLNLFSAVRIHSYDCDRHSESPSRSVSSAMGTRVLDSIIMISVETGLYDMTDLRRW